MHIWLVLNISFMFFIPVGNVIIPPDQLTNSCFPGGLFNQQPDGINRNGLHRPTIWIVKVCVSFKSD